ncbi:MAG: hypothetical protein HYZ27_11500 [Deltaproteobacteria bacterium]|nr:hypothetical protein [Deltaproteobacteria bacterium]
MVTMVVMITVLSAAMTFLIFQTRMSAASFDRADTLHGGRAAMNIFEDKIGNAGLGLPRDIAIKSYSATGDCNLPKLEVAALDYLRQWSVSGTTGSTASGTITLADDVPEPPTKADGVTSNDVAISAGRWVYLFQTFGADGFGMAKLGATRSLGNATITINSTAFTSSTSLNLDAGSLLNGGASGKPTALLLADVSGFGVDCTDVARPYLYWEANGLKTPIASYADTRVLAANAPAIEVDAGEVAALRFRFHLDNDPPEGDGIADAVETSLIFDTDPATATNDNVVAIEVLIRLRSERIDSATQEYRFEDFVRVIRTPNINTRATQYIFIDNAGI